MKFSEYRPKISGLPPIVRLFDITLDQLLQHPFIKSRNKSEYTDFQFCWKPDHQKWHKSALYCTWTEPGTGRFRWDLLGYTDEFLKELPFMEWPKEKDYRRKENR